MWEHRITLTNPGPQIIKRTLKMLEMQDWQVCAAIMLPSGLVQLIHKREHSTPEENDQAFQDLIEHHQQHHVDLEELQAIRSRAEKELERIKPGGAVWQALRYILDIDQ